MVTLFVKHTVKDYDGWKKVYDQVAGLRKQSGVTGATVNQDVNDPNIIYITHEFRDLDSAKAFAGSEDLKQAMAKAGVAGRPEMWFGKEIERTQN